MKLDYGQSLAGSQVLEKNRQRIELHLCRLDDELFTLIMLSGVNSKQATRIKQQGPYHSKDQAQAALNAIAKELTVFEFRLNDSPLIWQIQAQAELRTLRKTRSNNQVDTTFTPLGILPEGPES